jgi:hypothetical protein
MRVNVTLSMRWAGYGLCFLLLAAILTPFAHNGTSAPAGAVVTVPAVRAMVLAMAVVCGVGAVRAGQSEEESRDHLQGRQSFR